MMIIDSYRFGSAGGFRFLTDEISGALFSYGHIKTRDAYTGEAINLSSQGGYSFVDNVVPLATMQADQPTSDTVTLYDQIGANDMIGFPSGGWDGSDFASGTIRKASPTSYGLTLSDPRTTIMVIDIGTPNTGNLGGILDIFNSGSQYYTAFFTVGNDLSLRKRGVGNSTKSYSGLRTSGLHLFVWVDDGSLDSTGTNLYWTDMVTAKTASSTSGTTVDATINTSIGVKTCVGGNASTFNGLVKEFHQFDTVLSQSDREIAKEILEQYYTFS